MSARTASPPCSNLPSSSAPDSSKKTFACTQPDCHKGFTRKLALREHMRGPDHQNQKPFQCTSCTEKGRERAFTRINDLKRHEDETHDGKKFMCEQFLPTGERWGCGKGFTRNTTLRQHQKACEQIPKTTAVLHTRPEAQMSWPSTQETEARHVAQRLLVEWKAKECHKHTDDNFVCRICMARRRRDRIESYLHHLLGHLEDLRDDAFECESCGVGFALGEHLQRHKPQCGTPVCEFFQGPNPLELWGCGKYFSSREELLTHMRGLDKNICHLNTSNLKACLKSWIRDEIGEYGIKRTSEGTEHFGGFRYIWNPKRSG